MHGLMRLRSTGNNLEHMGYERAVPYHAIKLEQSMCERLENP